MKKGTNFLQAFLLICCLVSAIGQTAQAAVKYVKPTASGTGDGSSWANASDDLQAMINAANGGDEVWVAAGTYNVVVKVFGAHVSCEKTDTKTIDSDWPAGRFSCECNKHSIFLAVINLCIPCDSLVTLLRQY